jgi:hypothetical protein
MTDDPITVYFFSNAGEHGYAYARALGALATQSGYAFIHCSEGEPTSLHLDEMRRNPARSLALSINDSARRHQAQGLPLIQLLKAESIPHICFVIDHPLYAFGDWMNDGHTALLFTSPESEAFYKRHYSDGYEATTDYIWNVGFHYGTAVPHCDPGKAARRKHQLFVPINFDWQGETRDTAPEQIAVFGQEMFLLLQQAVEDFVSVQDVAPTDMATYLREHGYDPTRKPFLLALRYMDKCIAVRRRKMLLNELVKWPVTLASRAVPPDLIRNSKAKCIPYYTMMDSYRLYPNCGAVLNTSTSGTHIHDRVSNAMAAGALSVTQNNQPLKDIFPDDTYVGYDFNANSIAAALDTVFTGNTTGEIADKGWRTINDPQVFAQLYGGLTRLVTRCLPD